MLALILLSIIHTLRVCRGDYHERQNEIWFTLQSLLNH
nr:MAG TPA: hypothetical protein [Caudoviricetes sp.]